MTFSIVIPSYGQAQYLREAITSALSQTFKANDYEVIVVDDGGNDDSLEIAKEYSPRIKVISQVNKGLASARNTGIMHAQGEFVFFLDADDVLAPMALQEIYSFNLKLRTMGGTYFEHDVVAPSLKCVDEGGNTQDTILMKNPSFFDFKEGNRLAYCAAIRRSVLLEVGGYSPKMDNLGGWEDLHLWYNLMDKGYSIATIQKPLVMYRVKKDSMITRTKGKEKQLWEQIVKDFPRAKDHAKY